MTNEKAKEIGRRLLLHFEGEEKEAMETLLAVNEKQIMKKVQWGKTATRPNVTWICPVCRNHVNAEYCRRCGQAIDWSKENDE